MVNMVLMNNRYLTGSFRPLCIIIKDIKLYTNHKTILSDNKEFLKYTEV